jgi:hypothetical protein
MVWCGPAKTRAVCRKKHALWERGNNEGCTHFFHPGKWIRAFFSLARTAVITAGYLCNAVQVGGTQGRGHGVWVVGVCWRDFGAQNTAQNDKSHSELFCVRGEAGSRTTCCACRARKYRRRQASSRWRQHVRPEEQGPPLLLNGPVGAMTLQTAKALDKAHAQHKTHSTLQSDARK